MVSAKELKGFSLTSGMPVKVITPGPVPEGAKYDDDHQATSPAFKKRMLQHFFLGDRHLKAEISWIVSETQREALHKKGLMKVRVRDATGNGVVFTAPAENLTHG